MMFAAVIEVMRTHRLAVPLSLLLVFRTLGSLQGSLTRLDPGYDMTGRALERASHFLARMADLSGGGTHDAGSGAARARAPARSARGWTDCSAPSKTALSLSA